MTGESQSNRDTSASLSRFDPVAGMRVMADIQAEGLRAAGELLERVLSSEPDGNGRAPSPGGDYTALMDAWADLVGARFSDSLNRRARSAITVPVDGGGIGPPVRLALDESSEDPAAATEVWIHNATATRRGPAGHALWSAAQLRRQEVEGREGAVRAAGGGAAPGLAPVAQSPCRSSARTQFVPASTAARSKRRGRHSSGCRSRL